VLSEAGSPIYSAGSLFRHPIFLIAVIGIAARLLISPFAEVGYDSDFWATIIRNLESREGLYGLEGYYYSPVWGYILSFMSVIQELFLNIDVMGLRAVEAFPVESYTDWFFSATVTSVAFNFWIKIPFMISDLLVGYIVYRIIKDKTGDMKKATVGFALWFCCPLVICVTSISGMFDTFSVLFTLLCVVMVRKDKLFLAGVLLSFAVLTKFFPAYLIFILMAYAVVRHRGDGKAAVSLLKASAGMVLAFLVLMAPIIAEGSLSESLLFITSRAGGTDAVTFIEELVSKGAIAIYLIGIFLAIVLAFLLAGKKKDELDDSFFKYTLLMVAFVFVYPPTPQYLMLLIPFLVIYMLTQDWKFRWSWLLISLGGTAFILSGNFMLFLSIGTFTDLMSMDLIISMINWFHTPVLPGVSLMHILYNATGMIQYAGILSIIALFLKERYAGSRGGPRIISFGLPRFSSYRQPKS
jgi:Gpi18-like mannosyltransferase